MDQENLESINDQESNNSDSSNNERQYLNILSVKSTKINEKFIINFTKDSTKSANRDTKRNCKVAVFSSEWTLEELQSLLNTLNHEDFPYLFTFIINLKNVGFYKSNENSDFTRRKNKFNKTVNKITKSLSKFSECRPLLLQLTSEDENVTKIFFKTQNSSKFSSINQNAKNFKKFLNFPTFLCSFLEDTAVNNLVDENLSKLKNSSLILRFLRIFQHSKQVFDKLVLSSAAHGSKNDLLAALDAQFEGDGRLLTIDAQMYLKDIIIEEQNLPEANNDEEQIPIENNQVSGDNSSTSSSQQSSDNSSTSSISTNSHMNQSVLLLAIQNSNKPIIDFLITNCTHLIQELPFKHQVRVSSTAFETKQLDVLCDLLEISDFPFPENFQIDSIENERLLNIIDQRSKLQLAIETKSMKKISKFIDTHLSLRIVYSPTNKSALKIALDSKKYEVYFYLKSFGYEATEFSDIENVLNGAALKEARSIKDRQIRRNVMNALEDELSVVNLLCTRSFIHDRKIQTEKEVEYRSKIRKWYEDINKIEFGSELLNVAASCENLKIIFDFECKSVENVSLSGRNVQGSMYSFRKWIFIGAKLSDHKRNQQIKGVLAHELCHYVMKLVYENKEHPYYKHKTAIIKIFEAIVQTIDKWSAKDSEEPDDECNGIVSSVFELYDEEDFHPELIVRVMQILAVYDDDDEAIRYLKDKYKELFEYFRIYVLPDMESFDLKRREIVRKFNRIVGVLPSLECQEIEFLSSDDICETLEGQWTVVTTNVPKLLLINIHKCLKDKFGDLLDTKYIFIDPDKLKNQEICREYQNLLTDYPETRVFVDLSRTLVKDIKHIVANKKSSYVFVVSDATQREELSQKLTNVEVNPKFTVISYKWENLTAESQSMLMQRKINFQNNLQYSFYDLLDKIIRIEDNKPSEYDQNILQNFSEIVDDQLLNALVNNHQVSINSNVQDEKYFKFLYQKRNLRREREDPENKHIPKSDFWTQDEFIAVEVDSTYILISDMAGNGKSWSMKKFTEILRELNPTSWVTYVDLKQFIKEFREQMAQEFIPEFSTFMAEKILRMKHKFESKIFQKLYKNGKVFILFDGFDEIAPNCAEFVSNLAQSFQSNGGNQLWIATRDYFEVNLMEKLQLKTVFKLNDFKDEENIEQIVRLWIVNDFEKQDVVADLLEFARNFQNTANYSNLAEKVYEKISMKKYSWLYSLGGPQINKMVADISKNDKTAVLDLRHFQIFEKFIQNLYENWAYDKGQLRKIANIKNQNQVLNFWKYHQYAALKFFFPQYLAKFYPDYDESEWIEEEIIGCGLISNQYGFLSFTHKSFAEFFTADLILKYLKESAEDSTMKFIFNSLISRGPKECTVFIFVDVLTDYLGFYDVIRMLINEGIEDIKVLDGIKTRMSLFMTKFESIRNFSDFFTKNLDKLVDFVTEILKNGSYGKVKEILFGSAEKVVQFTENMEMYVKFQSFLFEFLKPEDLKDLITKQELLRKTIENNSNFDILEDFVEKIEAKLGPDFVKKTLQSVTPDGTILHFICKLPKKTPNVMKILKKYFNNSELIELTKILNKKEESMLHICVRNGNQILWMEIEEFYSSENLADQFKELVMQEADYEQNILDFLPSCHDIKFHKFFWNFFPNYFNNNEDLANFVLKKNKLELNFINFIIAYHRVPIRELTFSILKHNLTSTQYKQVLSIRDKEGRNILQIAAYTCHLSLHEHKATWKIVRDSCETDEEFLDILNQNDLDNVNILCHAVRCNSPDIIEFMIKELEKICSREELSKFLCSLYFSINQNLLLLASRYIKSLNTHKFLWDMFEKYVEPSKLLEFIQPCPGEYNCHILLCAVHYNNLEVVEFIWSKIKALIPKKEDQIEYLKFKNCYGEDFQKWSRRNFENPRVYKWVMNLVNYYGIPSWNAKEVKQ